MYRPLADAIAAALPGLWGHVGVDIIDGEAGPVVVEINPRLTTTYAGLRTAMGVNPAALVLRLLAEGPESVAEDLRPVATPVRVDADAA
jgi:predicted ATP-grasp superfamily ATP-dependent carboligase